MQYIMCLLKKFAFPSKFIFAFPSKFISRKTCQYTTLERKTSKFGSNCHYLPFGLIWQSFALFFKEFPSSCHYTCKVILSLNVHQRSEVMGFINKRLRSIVNCDLIPPTCHEISNSIDHFLCNQSYYFPQLASRNAVVTWWMLCASQLFWYRDWWCQGLWHSSWMLMSVRLFGFQFEATKTQNT